MRTSAPINRSRLVSFHLCQRSNRSKSCASLALAGLFSITTGLLMLLKRSRQLLRANNEQDRRGALHKASCHAAPPWRQTLRPHIGLVRWYWHGLLFGVQHRQVREDI